MAFQFPEAVAMQDNAAPAQEPPPPTTPHCVQTILKSQRTPKWEVQSVTHEEVYQTSKELLEFSGEYVWEQILRMWDNGRRNIKLDQAEYIGMGSQRRDSHLTS